MTPRRRALLALVVLVFWPGANAATQYHKQTPFQTLRVETDPATGIRQLCDAKCGFVQGTFDPAHPGALPDAYMRGNLALGLGQLQRPPRNILFIGMGTGAMARYVHLRLPKVSCDLVEIDPAVPPLARRYFGFPNAARLKVHIADARRFIEATARRYDLIFQDAAFGTESPRHLTTLEYLRTLAERLQPDGVVVANLAAPALNPRLNAMVATYKAVFAQVAVYPTESPANVALVATPQRALLTAERMQDRIREMRVTGVLDFSVEASTLAPLPWQWPEVPAMRDAPNNAGKTN